MAERDRIRNSTSRPRLIYFILLSIAVHGLILMIKIDVPALSEESLVSIKYFNYTDLKMPEAGLKKAVPEKVKEHLMQGTVVDIAKPETEKKPEKAKFLSEYDSSVKKESKSAFDPTISIRDRQLRKKLSIKTPQNDEISKDTVVSGVDSPEVSENPEKRKKGEMKGFEGDKGSYSKGMDKEVPGEITSKDKEDVEGSKFVGGHKIPARFLPYLNGSDDVLSSPSNDFLKDIETSNETLLNTNKFVYAAYFNKLKQAISKHWTPAYVLMINDPGGHLYGRKDRYTKLIVMINRNGTLKTAKVETSSGIDFLDREAINAFKMAAPFQNPPEVLLNKEGVLEIHFGFMVTMQ